MCRPYHLALLAEAYGKAGQGEEGLTALAEALAVVDRTGERMYEAELYRLKGAANASVVKHKVQSPKAKSRSGRVFLKGHRDRPQATGEILELRAAMSLARLWQQQGKQNEARELLAEDLQLVHRRV